MYGKTRKRRELRKTTRRSDFRKRKSTADLQKESGKKHKKKKREGEKRVMRASTTARTASNLGKWQQLASVSVFSPRKTPRERT
ncbi:hypothetical protein H6P81_016681 [Aristolochia fimbriata]|uniref:Uncharacterized protein n=1 Tax=Aristolochia fimbriata TaxID=158543 RepID=A0AAV7EA91_ARIFI|nr:hypothetical protein H6P81_016681 [Aristolochia fimbriata]